MNKLFKYSVIAVERPEEAVTHEIVFEKDYILKQEDQLNIIIGDIPMKFKVTSVRKIDHIKSPNDQYDYRLFAINI